MTVQEACNGGKYNHHHVKTGSRTTVKVSITFSIRKHYRLLKWYPVEFIKFINWPYILKLPNYATTSTSTFIRVIKLKLSQTRCLRALFENRHQMQNISHCGDLFLRPLSIYRCQRIFSCGCCPFPANVPLNPCSVVSETINNGCVTPAHPEFVTKNH